VEPERILPVLIFALVLFFQFVVPLLRRRLEEAAPDEGEDAITPERVVLERAPAPVVVKPAPVARAESRTPARPERRGPARRAAPPPPAPPLAVAPRRPSPLGSIAEVRRGIVLMTILGPCRAAEDPESHGAG
jgi:hypothetical protein